jgi:alpha-galactosidase
MTALKQLLVSLTLLAIMAASVFAAPPVDKPIKGPLKVFILAGQSNMEGAGIIKMDPNRNEGKGTLEYMVKDPKMKGRIEHLVEPDGSWAVRSDVWIWYFDRKGGLTAGYGAKETTIGPEFGFGHAVGEALDEQVLLIKTAWGGKSLAVDFRPPSSGGEVGPYYTEMLEHVKSVLGDIQTHFPEYDGKGYELAGFGWHQGWNDRINQAYNDAYEENMANFIRDVRKDLGVKNLPFVIAETGMSGHEETHPRALSLMKAQAAVAEHEEFKGNVAFVGTRDFYRPKEESPSGQAYHWNNNAETYFLIGDAMGKAMLTLLGEVKK